MKKAIITGADGFVGSNTVDCLLKNNIEVVAIDINEKPKRLKTHKLLQYICVDIQKPYDLLSSIKKNKYDTFFHFAWFGSSGIERRDYSLQIQNVMNTLECLKTAKELGCSRFVCAGSIMEKEVISTIYAQGTRPGMDYFYGVGKLLAHCLCKPLAAEIGIDLIWPMITNAYGEGELSPRFVNNTLRKIIKGEPLQFTSAKQNYDFVHVADVARAFYLIAMNGKPFCEYIIGSSKARPLKEFILEMQQTLAPNTVPIFGDIPFTGINMPLSTFNTDETEKDTGFKSEISFAEGTCRTMEWLKSLE